MPSPHALAFAALSLFAGDDPPARAFVGARVIPVGAPEIERGVLLVRDGRIEALGAEGEVAIPADPRRGDACGGNPPSGSSVPDTPWPTSCTD